MSKFDAFDYMRNAMRSTYGVSTNDYGGKLPDKIKQGVTELKRASRGKRLSMHNDLNDYLRGRYIRTDTLHRLEIYKEIAQENVEMLRKAAPIAEKYYGRNPFASEMRAWDTIQNKLGKASLSVAVQLRNNNE